jgi:hypothetical protein
MVRPAGADVGGGPVVQGVGYVGIAAIYGAEDALAADGEQLGAGISRVMDASAAGDASCGGSALDSPDVAGGGGLAGSGGSVVQDGVVNVGVENSAGAEEGFVNGGVENSRVLWRGGCAGR